MRDMTLSQDKKDHILGWMFALVMRLYGQNIYSDDSYIYKVFELESTEEIDLYFEQLLGDFKYRHRELSKLHKTKQKMEDILSR